MCLEIIFFVLFDFRLQGHYKWWLVGLTMGTCGIISGILVFFLPETNHMQMPDTVQEMEERMKTTINKQKYKEEVVKNIIPISYIRNNENL